MDTSDIRKNLKIMLDGQPYVVADFQFVKPGKGQPFTRCKLKNMVTGAALEKTFKSGEKLEPAEVEQRELQYIYRMATTSSSWMPTQAISSSSRAAVWKTRKYGWPTA
jgi:elongation factor P